MPKYFQLSARSSPGDVNEASVAVRAQRDQPLR